MKTITKTILTTIIGSSALLYLVACGREEPKSASDAAAEAGAQIEKAADSDAVKKAQQEAEAAAEEAKKKLEEATN